MSGKPTSEQEEKNKAVFANLLKETDKKLARRTRWLGSDDDVVSRGALSPEELEKLALRRWR